MNTLAKNVGRKLWANLGHCHYCTRKSFVLAVMSCVIAVACTYFLPRETIVPATVCSVALTALWIAHVTVFSLKASKRPSDTLTPSTKLSRRKAFSVFAKVLAAAALSSALPRIAVASYSDCCSLCPKGFHCVRNGDKCRCVANRDKKENSASGTQASDR